MKKLQFFLMVGAFGMLMASCAKEDVVGGTDACHNRFKINPPALTSDTKAFLDLMQQIPRILFEEGDPFYVNGVKFNLEKEGTGADAQWYANRADDSDEGVPNDGGYFYCCHADGAVSYTDASHSYNVNISSNNTTTTGVVLAGKTESNVVTLQPCFAVLVFQPKAPLTTDDYSSIRVGFATNNVPNIFTVSAESEAITAHGSYFPAVSQTPVDASFLTMHKIYDNYFYIAVPIEGNSKSMKLYMEYNLANGTTVKHVTKGNVTLEKGKVYMLPDETRNGYAFDENGAGVGVFSVSATQQVNFSAGNLQCVPQTGNIKWRFATHQYEYLNTNSNISNQYTGWIDLLGYGTSGQYVGSPNYAYFPFISVTTNNSYYQSDIAGTDADWGVANSSIIKYGNTTTIRSWRTLTSAEWTYLLNTRTNAAQKRGIACVNGNNGLVILPDSWTCPQTLSFNSSATSYTTNTYDIDDWDKMEKTGAIFLPAGGSRSGSTVANQNVIGYYWTSSAHYFVLIAANGVYVMQNTNYFGPHTGMNVRLVSNAN